MTRTAVLTALDAEAARLVIALRDAPSDDFARPTGCEPWTVRDLLAHVLVGTQRLPAMLEQDGPSHADVSALQYFRNDALGGAVDPERIDRARRGALEFATGADLVAAIVRAVATIDDLARRETDDRTVWSRWGDAMLLTEYLKTRVVELAVHGLDLAGALACEPWLSDDAATISAGVLTEDLDDDARRSLTWDRPTLLAKATGRLALTPTEAAHPIATTLLWARSP